MKEITAYFEISNSEDLLPCRIALNDTNNIFIHCNFHKEIEIIYIVEGNAHIRLNTDISHEISAGEALIVNSGEIHAGYPHKNVYCKAYAIIINLEKLALQESDPCQINYLSPFIKNFYKLPVLLRGSDPCEKEILNLIRKIVKDYYEKPYGYDFKIKVHLLNILSQIISNKKYTLEIQGVSLIKNSKIELLKQTINYIELNYKRKLPIQELAREINMSIDNYYKFFKTMTMKTPLEYIINLRINKAANLLKSTQFSILEIALYVGFEDVSFFIKTFKKEKGITPNKFRNSNP